MRMRRKKHLTERLSSVNDYLIVAERDVSNVLEAIKDKRITDYKKEFSNDNPIELEIGCGKGGFITKLAVEKPNKNYIAVEMMENIVLLACENAKSKNIKNVKFMNTGAEYLPRYIEGESVDNIYLNFSPPYPRKSYENRRLTNDRFIKIYKELLKPNGCVFQKTDDKDFFEYSLEKFKINGFIVENITEKLANNSIENIQTEYESKFREQGLDIYGLIAKKI